MREIKDEVIFAGSIRIICEKITVPLTLSEGVPIMKYALSVLVLFTAVFFCYAQQRTTTTKTTTFKTADDAVAYYEELVGTLVKRVTILQEENASLETNIASLKREMTSLSAKNDELSKKLAALEKQIAADAKRNEEQLTNILNQLKRIADAPAATTTTGDETYVEYVVQSGATLSAIARAYNVSMEDIKKANNMKNDSLRAGQTLKIPMK